MKSVAEPGMRPSPWRIVRVLASLGGLFAAVIWILAAYFMWLIRCDDVCSGAEARNWQWTAQFVLACFGAPTGVVALVLGFTRHEEAYRLSLGVALFTALVWVGWLFNGVATGA